MALAPLLVCFGLVTLLDLRGARKWYGQGNGCHSPHWWLPPRPGIVVSMWNWELDPGMGWQVGQDLYEPLLRGWKVCRGCEARVGEPRFNNILLSERVILVLTTPFSLSSIRSMELG